MVRSWCSSHRYPPSSPHQFQLTASSSWSNDPCQKEAAAALLFIRSDSSINNDPLTDRKCKKIKIKQQDGLLILGKTVLMCSRLRLPMKLWIIWINQFWSFCQISYFPPSVRWNQTCRNTIKQSCLPNGRGLDQIYLLDSSGKEDLLEWSPCGAQACSLQSEQRKKNKQISKQTSWSRKIRREACKERREQRIKQIKLWSQSGTAAHRPAVHLHANHSWTPCCFGERFRA